MIKKMYIGLHVKYPLFLSDFNETWISSTDFRKKNSNVKFHENPTSRSRVIPCGPTDGETDRHYKANSRFSQFCERAQKWREYLFWLGIINERHFAVTDVLCSSVHTNLQTLKIIYRLSDNIIIIPYVASDFNNFLHEFSCPRLLSVDNVLRVPPQGGNGREIWWPLLTSLWTKMSARYT